MSDFDPDEPVSSAVGNPTVAHTPSSQCVTVASASFQPATVTVASTSFQPVTGVTVAPTSATVRSCDIYR